MNPRLPESIDTYFKASNGKDTSRIALCFSEGAVVIDEGNTHRGHTAIQSWMHEAQTKYEYFSEPIGVTKDRERVVVAAMVNGNFPGSPVTLHYAFSMKKNKIQSLEIY